MTLSPGFLSAITLVVLVGLATVYGGGAHPETIAAFTVFGFVMTAVALVLNRGHSLSLPRNLLGLLTVLLWAQFCNGFRPPISVIEAISGDTVKLFDIAYHGIAAPDVSTLSLDPALTFQKSNQYFLLLCCLCLVMLARKIHNRFVPI